MNIDLLQLKRLMRAMRRYDLDEVELREGESTVRLRRSPRGGDATTTFETAAVAPARPSHFPMDTAARAAASGVPAAPAVDPDLVTVTAPLIGTFYRAASPQSRVFVEVGSTVQTGAVLCIIEAMKLMNEIESEVAGTVVEVLVENGRAVEFGEALFRVRPSR
ncbi:MAG: Biotin carboxyl carrier protein of acetyl-CoA carboxylase [Myxococcaceae bacterium]|nr:Biotin carboxyl carrier protein of acetyl-CoA carboxylase [Myxococcaceae bacterium]